MPETPSKIRTVRLGILGRFGSANLGNEATLDAALQPLARLEDEVRIDIRCSGPEDVVSRRQLPATPMHWFDRPRHLPGMPSRVSAALLVAVGVVADAVGTMRWVSHHDVVIVPGTGPFESTVRVRPWQTPWVLFIASLAGRLFRVRVCYLCVGATPPRDPATRWLLRHAAGLASYRSFRDEASRDAIASLGVDVTADAVFPDLVWSLPVPSEESCGRRASEMPARSVVGLGVMAYTPPTASSVAIDREEALIAAWIALTQHLIAMGHHVRLFYGDVNDRHVAEQIHAQVFNPSVSFAEVNDTATLMRELVAMDAVVATRFHNVLCALMCGVPTISVGYGRKHRDLMAAAGYPDQALDLNDLCEGRIADTLPALDRDRASVAARLAQVRERMRLELEPQLCALIREATNRQPRTRLRALGASE